MWKWALLVLGLVGGFAGLFVLMNSDEQEGPKVSPRPLVEEDAEPLPEVNLRPRPPRAKSDAGASGEPDVEQFDPKGEDFSFQVDVGIPNVLRAEITSCPYEDERPDASITLTYDLYIENGIVSTTNVKVAKSDLSSKKLEDCIVAGVLAKRWPDKRMPDFHESGELFIRMRTLDKYLDPEEQIRRKERRRINDSE